MRKKNNKASLKTAILEALEPRILFSSDFGTADLLVENANSTDEVPPPEWSTLSRGAGLTAPDSKDSDTHALRQDNFSREILSQQPLRLLAGVEQTEPSDARQYSDPATRDTGLSLVSTQTSADHTETAEQTGDAGELLVDDGYAPLHIEHQLEYIFVDSAVKDADTLISGLQQNADPDIEWRIVLLDADTDGIDRITAELLKVTGVNAVHLMSHSDGNTIQLGSAVLSTESANQYNADIWAWGQSLDADADLLIYGCDLGSSESGQALIDFIAETCNCDVAASNDTTGHEDLGGDWDLEYKVGEIETDVAASVALQSRYVAVFAPLDSGLVAHYRFSEGTGTTTSDSSANSNTGTFVNSPLWSSDSVADNAVNFSTDTNSNNAYITVADDTSFDFGSGAFSTSMWYKIDAVPAQSTQLLGNFTGTGSGFSILLDNTGALVLERSDGSVTTYHSDNDGSSISSIDGNWHHLVFSLDNNAAVTMTIDGVTVSSYGPATFIDIDTANPFIIGAQSATTGDFEGALDEVRIYNRALDANDALAIYQQGITTDLVADATTDSGGLSLNRDGGNDAYLYHPAAALRDNLTELTIEFQFSDLQTPVDFATLFSQFGSTSNDRFAVMNNGALSFFNTGTSVTTTSLHPELFDGNDHHVALTWDGSTVRFYVDGNFIESHNWSTPPTADSSFVIGQDQGANNTNFDVDQHFSGILKDVRFFNDVRSDAEIKVSYKSTLPSNEPGMIANWSFDDFTSGDRVTDKVSGLNLTLEHVNETTFSISHPHLTFVVDETALTGTTVGRVSAIDEQREAEIATLTADPEIWYSAEAGKFYKFVATDSPKTWVDAQADAVSSTLNGVTGNLVNIESAIENQLITDILGNSGRGWIGANDTAIEGEWRWSGDNDTQFWQGNWTGHRTDAEIWTNWNPVEPNNSNGTEHYGIINAGTGGIWGDRDNTFTFRSVVEYDAEQVLNASFPLSYSIAAQPVAGAFTIDTSTGVISVANASLLDYESLASHQLTVAVTGAGETYTENFIVELIDNSETTRSPGNLSSGIELNMNGGNNAYLITTNADAILGSRSSYTIETVFKAADNNTQELFSYETNNQPNALKIAIEQNGSLSVYINNVLTTFSGINYQILLDSEQHHLAVSWENSSGTMMVYVDGQLVDSAYGVLTGTTLPDADNPSAIVLGMDQDGVDNGYNPNESFRGTLYDVRVWNDTRSAAEIALNYQHKLDVTAAQAAAINLVANWQMAGITASDQVVDIVAGNNLTIQQATGSGFNTDIPVAGLHIDENSQTGITIGYSTPASEPYRDILNDGQFLSGPASGVVNAGQPVGDWTVAAGSITFNADGTSPSGGNWLELSAGATGDPVVHGSVSTTIITEPGARYQLVFAMSGAFGSGDLSKALRISTNGYAQDLQMPVPAGFDANSPLWDQRTFDFTADSASTQLSFTSLETSDPGAQIADISVTKLPQSVTHILNNNPELSYDSGSRKFYQFVQTPADFPTALNTATGTVLNGVSGQLATIRSNAENQSLRSYAYNSGNDIWLGATDSSGNGIWNWLQGTNETSETFWSAGARIAGQFAADMGLSSSADEYYLRLQPNGDWTDGNESGPYSFIIEWDAATVLGGYTYSLTDNDGDRFAIDPSSGEITIADSMRIDYETAVLHNVTAEVTDAAGNTTQQVIPITVNDAGEINNTANDLSSGIELNTDGGNDSYLRAVTADTVFGNATQLTVDLNFSLVEKSDSTPHFMSYSTVAQDEEFAVYLSTANQPVVVIGGNAYTGNSHPELRDPGLHQLSVSWNNTSGTVSIYVDGRLSSTGNISASVNYQLGATGDLIIGQRPLTGGMVSSNALEGTLYDVRVWQKVRSDSEIASTHQQKMDPAALPAGLLANWQMDSFDSNGEVVDVVASNNLSIHHATAPGLINSDPGDDLQINENTQPSVSIGYVVPTASEFARDLLTDGKFHNTAPTTTPVLYNTGDSIGDWTVSSGSVDLEPASIITAPNGSLTIDLSGDDAGTIVSNTIDTVAGNTYQLRFAVNGNYAGGDTTSKSINVSIDGFTNNINIDHNGSDWINPNWEYETITFTASSNGTQLQFESLENSAFGPYIADISLSEISEAIGSLLNNDATLHYNAASDKFYRLVTTSANWQDAQTNAAAAMFNGVSGNLAAIRSNAENTALQQILQDYSTSTAWIAGSDATVEGTWRWQDGTDETFYIHNSADIPAYSNFDATQPDGGGAENHIELAATNGAWNDSDGTLLRPYFVEWDAGAVLNSYTYSLVDPDGRFSIDSRSGEISFSAGVLDYETTPVHNVDITATNVAGSSFTGTLQIAVNNVGAELIQSLPISRSTDEETPWVFDTSPGNSISISDQGPDDASLRQSLEVSNGTLTFGSTSGITFIENSNGSSMMVIEGLESDINTALQNLTYTPNNDYTGADTLTIKTMLHANLEGYYNFEGSTATTVDNQSAGSTASGTLAGDAAIVDSGTIRGDVLSLDGTDDSVVINSTFSNSASLTLAAWINITATDDHGTEVISIGDNIAIRISERPDEYLSTFFYNGSTHIGVETNTNLIGSGWHHIAASFDDTSTILRLYVDGELVAQHHTQSSIDYSLGTQTRVGGHGNNLNTHDFYGQIDDARIYSRPLSADEISALAKDANSVTDTVALSVNPVNDPPQISASDNSAITYTENSAALPVNSTIVLQDQDDTDLASAVIKFDTGYDSAEDILSFVDQNGISGTFNSATGELNLTGVSSIANYQTALRSVTFANNSDDPSAATRTISFTVNDNDVDSNVLTRDISILPVNDAPALMFLETTELPYAESAGPVAITSAIEVGDADNISLSTATVSIASGYRDGEDILAFTNTALITGTWDNATGTLQLSGNDSIINYQNALRSVTYENISASPATGIRTISFTVNDGDTITPDSNTVNRNINVSAVNNAPTLTLSGVLNYTENNAATPLAPTAIAADVDSADFDGGTLTTVITSGAGTSDRLTIQTAGNAAGQINTSGSNLLYGGITIGSYAGGEDAVPLSIVFNNNATSAAVQATVRSIAYDNLSDSPVAGINFSMTLTDGDNGSVSQTQAIAITPVNDPPALSNLDGDTVSVHNNGTVYRVDVDTDALINDPDLPANFAGGSLTIAGTNFNSGDSIGLDTTGNVALSAGLNNGSTVSIGGTDIGVLSGVNTRGLLIDLNNNASEATVANLLQSLTFTSTSSVFGVRTIDFALNDGDGTANNGDDTAVADVNLFVGSAGSGSVFITEDDFHTFSATDFDFTGITGNSLQTITVTTLPVNGTLLLNGTPVTVNSSFTRAQIDSGLLQYHPTPDASGAPYDTFQFYINSGKSSVKLLPGYADNYAINSSHHVNALAILQNAGNFGPGGTVTTDIALGFNSATIDSAYLQSGEILYGSGLAGPYNASTLLAIKTWVQAGGILISPGDSTDYDDINSDFGLITNNSGSLNWQIADVNNPIVNGPFGLAGNLDDTIHTSGNLRAYFSTSSLQAGDIIVAKDANNGEPTIVYRAYGNGHIIFTGDEGVFRANTTGGGAVTTVNDRLVANIFALAAELAPVEDYHQIDIDVTPVNDSPVLSGIEAGSIDYTENDGPVQISSTLTLSDIDSATIESATVAITNNLVDSEDVLSFVDQNGITGNYVAATGTLTLSNPATINEYIAALQSVSYENTSDNPDTNTRTITFTVQDTTEPSNSQSRNIDISRSNDAPVLSIDNTPLSYTENSGEVRVTETLTPTDPDNSMIQSAVVSISGNFIATEDTLSYNDQFGIAGSYNAATGTLTLTGSSSLANYQSALRSITYSNNSEDPDISPRTVSFSIYDGQIHSIAASRDITPVKVNDSPVQTAIEPAAANYNENAANLQITNTIQITDPDDADIHSATVRISNNFIATEDTLSFTDQNGINGDYNPTTGELELSGIATISEYTAALRSIGYLNNSDNPDPAVRTISITINDDVLDSNTLTRDITVTPVNDAPTLADIETSAISFTENDNAVSLSSAVTLTDLDDTNIDSARIQITGGFVSTEDVLAFTDQNGISGAFVPASGTLTLTGSSSIADYLTAIRSVTYLNTSDNPDPATRTFSITINDGALDSNTLTRDIAVAPVNDAPTLADIETSAINFTENDNAVSLSSAVTLTDLDDINIDSARIQITGGFVSTEDVLSFTDQNGISGVFDSNTGELSLNGTATLLQYQTALRSITYNNTSDNPDTATRTLAITVNDGDINSNTLFRDLQMTAVNDASVLSSVENSALAYTENEGAVFINQTIEVTDLDNNFLQSAIVSITDNFTAGEDFLSVPDQNGITADYNAANGTLSLSGIASVSNYQTALRDITYSNTSEHPSPAPRSISFTVSDGTANSNTLLRQIDIIRVNDAPVQSTLETNALLYSENDTATAITSTLTLSDLDDSHLQSATIQFAGGYVSGEDELDFPDSAAIAGQWDSASGTLTLTGNDTIAGWQAALRAVTYINTSDNPDTTPRQLIFTVNDGVADSSSLSREILITADNDAPTLSNIEFGPLAFTENSLPRIITDDIVLAELDDEFLESAVVKIVSGFQADEDRLAFTNTANISATWNSASAELVLAGTDTLAAYQTALRSVTYMNSSDNPDTTDRVVEFTINDGDSYSNSVARSVIVNAVNDAPTNTLQDTAALIYPENAEPAIIFSSVTLADADNTHLEQATIRIANGYAAAEDILAFTDTATISGVWDSTSGNLVLSGSDTISAYQNAIRTVTYQNTSDNPDTSARTLSISVSDGSTVSDAITRSIVLISINDAPSGSDNIVNSLEDTDYIFQPADFGFSDPEDSNNFDSVLIEQLPSQGELRIDNNPVTTGQIISAADINAGLLLFTPLANENGLPYDSLVFRVGDDGGTENGGSNTAAIANLIDINIANVNDAPRGEDNSIRTPEDTTYVFSTADFPFSDVLDNNLFSAITITSRPTDGSFTLNGEEVRDGQVISVADIDAGLLQYTPASNDSGTNYNGFSFQVHDDGGETNGGISVDPAANFISFDVPGVNDAPLLQTSVATFDEGSDNIVTTDYLSATDADDLLPEELTFTINSPPVNGILTLGGIEIATGDSFTLAQIADDSLRYRHDGSETDSDHFFVTLTDGGEDGVTPVTARFSLIINEVIDAAPVLDNDKLQLEFGKTFDSSRGDELESGYTALSSGKLLNNTQFTVTIETLPMHGWVEVNADGTFTYKHNGSIFLQDEFSYRVTNEDGVFTIATVAVTVDPPLGAAFSNETPTSPPAASGESSEPASEPEEAMVYAQQQPDIGYRPLNIDVDNKRTSLPSPSDQIRVLEMLPAKSLVRLSETYLEVKQHAVQRIETIEHQNLEISSLGFDVIYEIPKLKAHEVVTNQKFLDGLARLDSDLAESEHANKFRYTLATETLFGVSISATAGALAWALRGGALFASVMASTPLWASLDPMKALTPLQKKDDEATDEDTSVEKLFD